MTCHACNSTELVFVESHADSAVVGGFVRKYICTDCGALNEDVPPEIYDEKRDREMTEQD